MAFSKKRIFLYSSILLLILVGVYFVNSVGFANRNPTQSFVNATGETNTTGCNGGDTVQKCGGLYSDLANWTRGGNTETYRFTIDLDTYSSGTANNNVTRINISGSELNAFPTGASLVSLSGLGNATFRTGGGGNNNWSINVTGAYVSASNQSYPIMGSIHAYQNITIHFNVTVANSTEAILNWTISIYNSTGGAEGTGVIDSGLGLLTGIDGLPPRLNQTNVTDGVNTRTSFSSTQYLKYDSTQPQQGINITISLNDYNIDRVLLVYNNTGGAIDLAKLRSSLYNVTFLENYTNRGSSTFGRNVTFEVLANNGSKNLGESYTNYVTSRSDVRLVSPPLYEFRFNISNGTWGQYATDGTLFKYVFVVYDLYNNSEIINNSNAEYVIARDTANPTVTLTAPSDTTITVSNSIKYTCNGADGSGLASCSLKLTKPGETTVTKTGCGTEQTFTLTDTNEAGTNTVDCTVTDNVGHTASTSSTFSVSAATTGGAGAGGGGGGGGAGSTPENPVTVQQGESVDAGTLTTTETYTSVAKEGTVTFMVASASHSVKVLDVTTTSVTIEISSTPQQLTLTIGETKEVDLTDDGKNDLSVTLKSITNEKADLVFKSLEVVAPPAEEEKPGVVTGEEAKPSYTWLWIVLIVIVVVLIIWYLSRKKQ